MHTGRRSVVCIFYALLCFYSPAGCRAVCNANAEQHLTHDADNL